MLCAVHKTPGCLIHAHLTALIANTKVSALIDTGSSSSFINVDTVKHLEMKIIPCYENILMALSSTENVHDYCNTDVQINGSDCNDVKLKVLKNLCSDILLRQDFQSQHKQVIFEFKGKKDNFAVLPTCMLSSASSKTPSVFHNLSKNCKPIAVKFRCFNSIDQLFIDGEINHLYSDSIIKSSISP